MCISHSPTSPSILHYILHPGISSWYYSQQDVVLTCLGLVTVEAKLAFGLLLCFLDALA
jgi:hypothetical protein